MYYLNFSFFTVFLKKRNISSKIKRSKITDYAALSGSLAALVPTNSFIIVIYDFIDRTFNSYVMGFSCVTPQGQLPKKKW